MSPAFEFKKQKILQALAVPEQQYSDRSPKGTIDEGIRELVDDINGIPGLVTTSSCAGRISVFLEGTKKVSSAVSASNTNTCSSTSEDAESTAVKAIGGPGGKGGGRWLFVSHSPLSKLPKIGQETSLHSVFGLQPDALLSSRVPLGFRLVHFKFEAMILHLSAASLQDAQAVLSAAAMAGFRESGAMSLNPNADGTVSPMVAVRSTGLAFDTVIGYMNSEEEIISIVTESHLRLMVDIANERFRVNTERIERFRSALLPASMPVDEPDSMPAWEDKAARQARKRQEGLANQRGSQRKRKSEDPANSCHDQSAHE